MHKCIFSQSAAIKSFNYYAMGEGMMTFFMLLRDLHTWKDWEPFLCWSDSLFTKHTSWRPYFTPFLLSRMLSRLNHDLSESHFSLMVYFNWYLVSESFSCPWSQKCSSVPIFKNLYLMPLSHTSIVDLWTTWVWTGSTHPGFFSILQYYMICSCLNLWM